jgi:hypothetical protein
MEISKKTEWFSGFEASKWNLMQTSPTLKPRIRTISNPCLRLKSATGNGYRKGIRSPYRDYWK